MRCQSLINRSKRTFPVDLKSVYIDGRKRNQYDFTLWNLFFKSWRTFNYWLGLSGKRNVVIYNFRVASRETKCEGQFFLISQPRTTISILRKTFLWKNFGHLVNSPRYFSLSSKIQYFEKKKKFPRYKISKRNALRIEKLNRKPDGLDEKVTGVVTPALSLCLTLSPWLLNQIQSEKLAKLLLCWQGHFNLPSSFLSTLACRRVVTVTIHRSGN